MQHRPRNVFGQQSAVQALAAALSVTLSVDHQIPRGKTTGDSSLTDLSTAWVPVNHSPPSRASGVRVG